MTQRCATVLRALLVGAALALPASVLTPAHALDGGDDTSIAHVEAGSDGLEVLVSVPAGAQVDLDDVSLTVTGAEAEATAERASGTTAVSRTSVLAIDTSNSMSGARFEAARAAALAYLDAVPEDVEVGIVAFSSTVEEALAPTSDRQAAREVIGGLTLSRETRLYDGLLAAVDMAGSEGQRTLLVLSDGADTTDTSLDSVTTAIEESGVIPDIVSLDQEASPALRELAAAGDGRVISAGSEELAATFADEAEVLARQVLVSAEMPASVDASEGTISVTLASSRGPLTAESFVPLGARAEEASSAPPVVAPDRGVVLPDWLMYAAAGLVGVGLLGVLGALFSGRRVRALGPEEAITRYAGAARGAAAPEARDEALSQAKDAAAQVLATNKSLEERIATRLEAAGSEFKSAEWLLLQVGVAIGAAVVGTLLSGGNVLVGVLFLLLGVAGPWLWLGFRRSRRVKAFNAALPDTLQLMSGSLSAGMSLAQSLDTIVREGGEPMTSEFRRVLVESRLGVPLEDSLERVAQRFDSKDFGWVVMAIRIQRQVGGNLAELLDTVAATIREREYLRRQVLSLSAEGRLSAWVLGALPPLFFLYLMFSQRDYISVLYTTTLGWLMLGGALTLLAVGSFWMSKLVKVEV